MLSVLNIFRVGIGPSSSHTVGPMRIAERFVKRLHRLEVFQDTARIRVDMRGSLAFTGEGHGSLRAALLGLAGLKPESFEARQADQVVEQVLSHKRLSLGGEREIDFDFDTDIRLDYDTPADLHPNEMAVFAFNAAGDQIAKRTYYSTGGGFIASRAQLLKPVDDDIIKVDGKDGPYQFTSAEDDGLY